MLRITLLLAVLLVPALAVADAHKNNAHESDAHKLVIHVNENDPRLFHEILTNINNLEAHYQSLDQDIIFEVVAYGQGLNMLIKDESPVEDRVEYMSFAIENITFTACGNTLDAREKSSGERPELIYEVTIAQTGIARIIALQEMGYSYLKP